MVTKEQFEARVQELRQCSLSRKEAEAQARQEFTYETEGMRVVQALAEALPK